MAIEPGVCYVIQTTNFTQSYLAKAIPEIFEPDRVWGDEANSHELRTAAGHRLAQLIATRIHYQLPPGYEFVAETGTFMGQDSDDDWQTLTHEHVPDWRGYDGNRVVYDTLLDVLATQVDAVIAEVKAVADAVVTSGIARQEARKALAQRTADLRDVTHKAIAYGFSELYLERIGQVRRSSIRGWEGKRRR